MEWIIPFIKPRKERPNSSTHIIAIKTRTSKKKLTHTHTYEYKYCYRIYQAIEKYAETPGDTGKKKHLFSDVPHVLVQ